jgi:glucose/arabinose dehydrogenase
MLWSRIRIGVAAVLLAIAGILLYSRGGALLSELSGLTDSASGAAYGAPTLPEGAAARHELPGEAVARDSAAPAAMALVEVARGFDKPLFATAAGDGSARLFVVEQDGLVRIVENGAILERPFLDLTGVVDRAGNERGLLGLAFAPDYARSGRFFAAYTLKKSVRVARFEVSSDPRVAKPAATPILDMEDPASNHNGGMVAFGPDGMLWVGTGDGGAGGDPWNNAQNPRSLLGKMLRLDVSGERYTVPPDNPFAGRAGHAPEIWATGLRNPWRYSFDRATGELWIGDVGQNAWEEIDAVDSRTGGGANFGWRTMEGFHCYDPRQGCDTKGLTLPLHAYGHNDGCSVTGGHVYRGAAIPALAGAYIFADYCNGRIWALRRDASGRARVERLLDSGLSISSFGEDPAGELFVCDHGGGRLLRIAPPAS